MIDKKVYLQISIIIRCCNDYRVFNAIKSIDYDLEIVVSLCCGDDLKKRLVENNIKVVDSIHGNLSLTSNRGISSSLNSKMILIDSDTIFNSDIIEETYNQLNSYDIINLGIIFDHKNIFQKIVAVNRQYVNSKVLAFTPGIAFTKNLVSKFNGNLFNENISFAVDAELNFKLKKMQPKSSLIYNAIIHDGISIFHDLKAAKRIGGGCKMGEVELGLMPNKFKLKVVKLKDYKSILLQNGLLYLIYQFVWDLWFIIGYFSYQFRR